MCVLSFCEAYFISYSNIVLRFGKSVHAVAIHQAASHITGSFCKSQTQFLVFTFRGGFLASGFLWLSLCIYYDLHISLGEINTHTRLMALYSGLRGWAGTKRQALKAGEIKTFHRIVTMYFLDILCGLLYQRLRPSSVSYTHLTLPTTPYV